jgi:magnesium chelatase family protein
VVSRVRTVAFQGIEVLDIDVQVQIPGGMPQVTLVGLPDKAGGESRERVRSALCAGWRCRPSGSRSIWPRPTC